MNTVNKILLCVQGMIFILQGVLLYENLVWWYPPARIQREASLQQENLIRSLHKGDFITSDTDENDGLCYQYVKYLRVSASTLRLMVVRPEGAELINLVGALDNVREGCDTEGLAVFKTAKVLLGEDGDFHPNR